MVTFDYGLSEAPGESETVTKFRNELVRNPRYLSLNTQKTGKWLVQDDYVALVYSIADFWKDELPWDGRTTNKLVLEVKDGYDVKSLLPPELRGIRDFLTCLRFRGHNFCNLLYNQRVKRVGKNLFR